MFKPLLPVTAILLSVSAVVVLSISEITNSREPMGNGRATEYSIVFDCGDYL